jgi:PAS domain S-box-containing protein
MLLGVLLVLALLAFLIVRQLIDRLTAPLTRLTMEVRELSDPDKDVSLSADGQYRELGALADSIQKLLAHVADRRRAMKEQILFLQNLMETIPLPVFYKDAEFRYLGCNTLFSEFFNLPREELLGRKVTDFIDPDLAAIHVQADQELWRRGGQTSYEREITSADGDTRYVLFHKKVFRLASGEPGGLIGTCLDMTERRQYEQELRQALQSARAAEQQVSNILRSVSGGLIVTDWSGRIIHLNTVAEEIIGMQAIDLAGKRFTKLFGNPLMREGMRNFVSQADPEARCQDFVITGDALRPDRVLQARSSVMRGEAGQPIGLVTILQDVTRERDLDRIKSEFISTAAHELRTPVTVIMGYAELLLNAREHGTYSADQTEKFLQHIFRMGEILSRLVEDLLDISRIEAGLPVPLEYEACPVSDIAQELLHRYRTHHGRHNFVFTGDSGNILADGVKLAQVFENLISNAVKYSPQGGTVSVNIDDRGDLLEVEVADEGIGMTPYQVERIFDRFYRADSSNTSVGGLGIGMSIVKSIVEGHGGSIAVESAPGQWTRVRFTIPKRPDAAANGSAL